MSTPSTSARVGRRQLQAIADQLDTIDRQLLGLLVAHRYATTRQLARIISLTGRYASDRSALRQTSRRLSRHRQLGLTDHLERRIGGAKSGSTSHVWRLREPGHRLTSPDATVRKRTSEPSYAFLAHTLAITEARLIIEQAAHHAGGRLTLLATEPECWRTWHGPAGTKRWLKPDLEAITTTAHGDQDHWLLEIDLGTENPARLLAKCHDYQTHLNTGTEQATHGYYPQVVWLLNNPDRATRLTQQITNQATFTPGLFKITASPEELTRLIQNGP
ncbi:replication-relaxation family protein [Actinomyces glycerinitolerans]|uniref:Plasmid replication-relaxation n=1 Tax=Actinomyces glycerinitolerans TaxID=1892869 RepID=A0A1M4RZZ7_9ACTO|nr:replication-relaxation family protein [Actinomyces glycerinitolerans]SHE25555.1 plasmid replication-relaxation [Actinomyces glycerinitolerans]